MNTNNIPHISPNQPVFSNLAEMNQDPSCLSLSTPPPPKIIQPIPAMNPPCVVPPRAVPRPPPKPNAPNDPNAAPDIEDIMDYMDWSIVNIFLGGVVLGIFCYILSKVTDKYKKKNDFRLARIYSRLTLALNIFITITFMCAVVGIITYFKGVQ